MKANVEYGLLYNWYAATDVRNIAPAGWHVPTTNEYIILRDELGGVSIAGGKMKAVGLDYWKTPNTGATNESGFNSFGNGGRLSNGSFSDLKSEGRMWTCSTLGNPTYKANVYCGYYTASFYTGVGTYPIVGYAIRLVKDNSTDEGTMKDNNGVTYPTVKIGNQVWMAANLKTTKYRNGDTIPEVTNSATWGALTTGALCAYNNDWNNV